MSTAFGLSAGAPPEPFLLGMAVLGLFAESAADVPLVCVVDDVQWLDRHSALILGFVARRLAAESVALVFAVRSPADSTLAGLPELWVGGLGGPDAPALLDSVLTGPVDARRARPHRGRDARQPAGAAGAAARAVRGRAGGRVRRPRRLPLPTGSRRGSAAPGRAARPTPQRLLLVAAAEPVGDALLVWRAAARLGRRAGRPGPGRGHGLIESAPRSGSGIRWCARPS